MYLIAGYLCHRLPAASMHLHASACSQRPRTNPSRSRGHVGATL